MLVRLEVHDSRLWVDVALSGANGNGGWVTALEDRVGALDGSLTVDNAGPGGDPVQVVIADDEALLREGLVRLLGEVGCEVVGTAATAVELLRVVERTLPDAVLIDIRMPPTHTDEGLVAAREIRARWPDVGVLVMSHFIESRYAMRLLESHPGGSGYLLKHRVSDVAVLADALHRVCDGECVLDPTIVRRLLAKRSRPEPLGALTEREREVLALMAEGHSNIAVSEHLALRPKTVEAHVKSCFSPSSAWLSPQMITGGCSRCSRTYARPT